MGRQGTGGRPRKDEQKPTAVLLHVSGELNGNNAGIYGLSDHVEPEQLEEALIDAKAEGNLSRANVVRKVAWDRWNGPTSGDDISPQHPRHREARTCVGHATDAYTSSHSAST